MKTTRTLATAILASSLIFASCSKEDKTVTPDPVTGTAATAAAKTIESTKSFVRFAEGYAVTDMFRISTSGRPLYERLEADKVQLLSSLTGQTDIASGEYREFEAIMRVVPLDNNPSITLRGEAMGYNGASRPVVFMINSVAHFYSAAANRPIDGKTTVFQLFNINHERLGANVSVDMWERAEKVNGEIVVSRQHNEEIYSIMIDNMRSMAKMELHE